MSIEGNRGGVLALFSAWGLANGHRGHWPSPASRAWRALLAFTLEPMAWHEPCPSRLFETRQPEFERDQTADRRTPPAWSAVSPADLQQVFPQPKS